MDLAAVSAQTRGGSSFMRTEVGIGRAISHEGVTGGKRGVGTRGFLKIDSVTYEHMENGQWEQTNCSNDADSTVRLSHPAGSGEGWWCLEKRAWKAVNHKVANSLVKSGCRRHEKKVFDGKTSCCRVAKSPMERQYTTCNIIQQEVAVQGVKYTANRKTARNGTGRQGLTGITLARNSVVDVKDNLSPG